MSLPASEKSRGTTPQGITGAENAPQNKEDDIAIAIVGERRHDIDPAIEARVVRKIDQFLLPVMFIGYGLVYYDKVEALMCANGIQSLT